jgi:formate dehydrogenase subunit gamma
MSGSASVAKMAPSTQILRFRRSERLLHWSIAVPFMICYATAAALFLFFNLRSPQTSRLVLSWVHRVAGAGLIAFPLLTVLRNRREYRVHFDNIKQAWIWAWGDIKWLLLMGAAAVNSKIKLPEQGKFNAAEKLNFMMVMGTYPIFIVTGLLLWVPGIHFVSWTVHVGLAVIATPLMLGHIYMALVNPSTRVGLSGMVSGYVDRDWASEHYHRWYRENFEKPAVSSDTGRERAFLGRPVLLRCPSCNAEHAESHWPELLQMLLELRPFHCPKCKTESKGVPLHVEPDQAEDILSRLQQAGIAHYFETAQATSQPAPIFVEDPTEQPEKDG